MSWDLRGRPFDPKGRRPRFYTDSLWAFLLEKQPGDRTRLVVSGYWGFRPQWLQGIVGFLFVEPSTWIMQTRQFAGAAVHPRFGTPARAVALQAALASLLVALGTFQQIVSYFIFVTVLFVALTVAALFVLRRREVADAPYRTPGYPVTPVVFLLIVAVLLILLAGRNPGQAALGAGIVGLGLPVYLIAFSSAAHPRTDGPR